MWYECNFMNLLMTKYFCVCATLKFTYSQKQLEEYKTEHGDCNVPTKYKHNTALGRWVSTVRAEFKKFQRGDKKAAIDSERICRLESIGFVWFPLVCEVAKNHYSESRR